MSKLSELLNAENPQGWSLREIARRAQQRGHTLEVSTVSRYFSGKHGIPGESVLRAFHEVLNIPMADLRTAADLPAGAPGPYAPPDVADRLDLDQREAVDQIIRLLARKAVVGNESSTAPMTTGEPASTDETALTDAVGTADAPDGPHDVPPSAEGTVARKGPRRRRREHDESRTGRSAPTGTGPRTSEDRPS